MDFNAFPVDIQIEILKYNLKFRGVNKTIHREGLTAFNELYLDLPLTMNEFINDYFYNNNYNNVMIYTQNDLDVNLYIILKYNGNYFYIYHYDVKYNPFMFKPSFYVSSIELRQLNSLTINAKELCLILHNLKNYEFDFLTSLTLIKNRGVKDSFLTAQLNKKLEPVNESMILDINKLLYQFVQYFNLSFTESILTSKPQNTDLTMAVSFREYKAVHSEKFKECINHYKKLNSDLQETILSFLKI